MCDSENGLLNKEIGRCGVLCYMKIMNNDTVSVVMGGGYSVCRVYDVLYVIHYASIQNGYVNVYVFHIHCCMVQF